MNLKEPTTYNSTTHNSAEAIILYSILLLLLSWACHFYDCHPAPSTSVATILHPSLLWLQLCTHLCCGYSRAPIIIVVTILHPSLLWLSSAHIVSMDITLYYINCGYHPTKANKTYLKKKNSPSHGWWSLNGHKTHHWQPTSQESLQQWDYKIITTEHRN